MATKPPSISILTGCLLCSSVAMNSTPIPPHSTVRSRFFNEKAIIIPHPGQPAFHHRSTIMNIMNFTGLGIDDYWCPVMFHITKKNEGLGIFHPQQIWWPVMFKITKEGRLHNYPMIPWSHYPRIIRVFPKNPSIIPWFVPLGLQFIGHCYPNPCYPTSWVFWCEPPRKIKPGWEIPALEKWKFQASQGAEY